MAAAGKMVMMNERDILPHRLREQRDREINFIIRARVRANPSLLHAVIARLQELIELPSRTGLSGLRLWRKRLNTMPLEAIDELLIENDPTKARPSLFAFYHPTIVAPEEIIANEGKYRHAWHKCQDEACHQDSLEKYFPNLGEDWLMPYSVLEERRREGNTLVAARIRQKPDLLDEARKMLAWDITERPELPSPASHKRQWWQYVLGKGASVNDVADLFSDDSLFMRDMHWNSPFRRIKILANGEWAALFAKYRNLWNLAMSSRTCA